MKVYIITDGAGTIYEATLSKETANQLLHDYADLDEVIANILDTFSKNYDGELDEEKVAETVEKEFDEWCEDFLNDDAVYIPDYKVCCEIVELTE